MPPLSSACLIKIVADRFGYSVGYVRLLRHMFVYGKIDFAEPVPEGKAQRRQVSQECKLKIIALREKNFSSGQITKLLSEYSIEISVKKVERILAEEGFPKLPRCTCIQVGMTIKGAEIPGLSEVVSFADLDGQRFNSTWQGNRRSRRP